MRKKRDVPLSQFVKEDTDVTTKCISLQNRCITVIDELSPFLCSQIQSLNLHNNKLSCLKGISQFGFLKELDLSSNKLVSCGELNCLRGMFQLKKLYISNNPFLMEPLDENILQFILEKETDIQILSFELLNTLKQVQEEQIKIIFLKNYISKLELHDQLKQKEYISRKSRPSLNTESLMQKIIPQFYTIIEDPKMSNKIKKEAFDLKKQRNSTFELALQQTKDGKEQKINQLIGDIFNILHQNESFKQSRKFMLEVNFNDNTITFSPEKQRHFQNTLNMEESAQYSPVKVVQFSKDDNSLEEITLTNNKHFNNHLPGQSLPNKQTITKAQTINFDNLQTNRKQSNSQASRSPKPLISQKLKQFSQMKNIYQSQVKKIKEKEAEKPIAQNPCTAIKDKFDNQISFKTPPYSKQASTQRKDQIDKKSFIKVIEENDSQQIKKQSEQFKRSPNISPRNYQHQSQISWKTSLYRTGELTPEAIEAIYFKTLSKTNPMFVLLTSPANSLNAQQKNTILDALKIDHRQKFIELLKQKSSNQSLMRELQMMKNEYDFQIEKIVGQNRLLFQQNLKLKEQFQWMDNRHIILQNDYNAAFNKNKELELSEKKKVTAIALMEASYKKIKEAYKEKNQQIMAAAKAEDQEELITGKRQSNIKLKYLKHLAKKAKQWKSIFILQQKCKQRNQQFLKVISVQAFKQNLIACRNINKYINKSNKTILCKYFQQWISEKNNQKKARYLALNLKKKWSKQWIKTMKQNQAQSKLNKLKLIWSQRFYRQAKSSLSFCIWKQLRAQIIIKQQTSINYSNNRQFETYFTAWKQIVKTRRQAIQNLFERHMTNKRNKQFKRMVFIMRKETIQIQDKANAVRLGREKNKKLRWIRQFIKHIHACDIIKRKVKQFNTYLKKKNFQNFTKSIKTGRKKQFQLKKHLFSFKLKISLAYLIRQKKSNDFNKLLINRRLQQFTNNLKHNCKIRIQHRQKQRELNIYLQTQFLATKYKFLKYLQLTRLKGKNYIKARVIDEMSLQMDLNDINAIQIVKQTQQNLIRCEKDIQYLKGQIQTQSMRQMILMKQKDEMMHSFGQSCQLMQQMKMQIINVRREHVEQLDKYDQLATLYNSTLAILQQKKQDCEWLYDTIRDNKQ